MQADLPPCQNLKQFVKGAETARHRNEPVSQLCHQRLSLMHGARDVKLREPCVRNLALHHGTRNHAGHLPARRQTCIRHHTHQTHPAAAVNESDAP